MHGKTDALSASEQRGAAIFVGRGKCAGCHSGPFLSDQKFHNVGLKPTPVAVVFTDQGDTGAVEGLAAAIGDELNVKGKFSDGDDGRLPATVDPAMTGGVRRWRRDEPAHHSALDRPRPRADGRRRRRPGGLGEERATQGRGHRHHGRPSDRRHG